MQRGGDPSPPSSKLTKLTKLTGALTPPVFSAVTAWSLGPASSAALPSVPPSPPHLHFTPRLSVTTSLGWASSQTLGPVLKNRRS